MVSRRYRDDERGVLCVIVKWESLHSREPPHIYAVTGCAKQLFLDTIASIRASDEPPTCFGCAKRGLVDE